VRIQPVRIQPVRVQPVRIQPVQIQPVRIEVGMCSEAGGELGTRRESRAEEAAGGERRGKGHGRGEAF